MQNSRDAERFPFYSPDLANFYKRYSKPPEASWQGLYGPVLFPPKLNPACRYSSGPSNDERGNQELEQMYSMTCHVSEFVNRKYYIFLNGCF